MPTHILKREYQRLQSPAETITREETITADSGTDTDITAPDSATTESAIAIDVSELKSLYIDSDFDVTIKTNSEGAPDDTIPVTGGLPIMWSENDDAANPFDSGIDVTSFHVVNASGSEALVRVRVLQDSTP